MPIAHVSTYSITVEHYDFGIFFPPRVAEMVLHLDVP